MNDNETIEATAQEVADIVYQRKFDAGISLLQMRFEVGEVLIASPLWEKATRGQLLAQIEAKTNLGGRSLRYCADFKEKYGTWENVMATADGQHKLPAWREIVKGLPTNKEEKADEEVQQRCKKCFHCPQDG